MSSKRIVLALSFSLLICGMITQISQAQISKTVNFPIDPSRSYYVAKENTVPPGYQSFNVESSGVGEAYYYYSMGNSLAWRCFCIFDTSGIPDYAVITDVDFIMYGGSQDRLPPYQIQNFTARKGIFGYPFNASEWYNSGFEGDTYGVYEVNQTQAYSFDLGSQADSDISKTGDSKIVFFDGHYPGTAPGYWGMYFMEDPDHLVFPDDFRAYLQITYQLTAQQSIDVDLTQAAGIIAVFLSLIVLINLIYVIESGSVDLLKQIVFSMIILMVILILLAAFFLST